MKLRHTKLVVGLVILAAVSMFVFHGCASTIPNTNPTGSVLPSVKGESLSGVKHELPADLFGDPSVLLVGYVQGTQFDIDRWIMALLQQKTPARIVEVPTIDGIVPTMISGWIDSGMRSGIPSEDWPAVITVYGGEASLIVKFTGNESPRNARVLVLDAEGRVVWFHDRGFSPSHALALDARVRELSGG